MNDLELIARALAAPEAMSEEDHRFLRKVYGRKGYCSLIQRPTLKRILRDFAVYLVQPERTPHVPYGPHAWVEPAHRPEPRPESQPSLEGPIAAPITVYSRRETDESYEGVISRESDLRIVNCRDDLQWIVQAFKGGQWRNKSFHRTRRSLIQRYGPLEMLLALPEHHDGFVEVTPRCEVCGRIKSKPTAGLPRHMFCIAARNRQRIELMEASMNPFVQRRRLSLRQCKFRRSV